MMRFAEVAMEVEVAKPRNLPDLGAGMTPGRRKANMIFKQARAKVLTDEMLVQYLQLHFPAFNFLVCIGKAARVYCNKKP